MTRRRKNKKKIRLDQLFQVKIRVNKRYAKQALWLLSVIVVGYFLFLSSQYVFHTKPDTRKTRTRFTGPVIAFVIDDIGAHNKLRKQMERLGANVTYAVLPLLPYSKFFGELAKKNHTEVILHLPLDTTQDMIPGRGLIVSTMSKSQILEMLATDIASVPNITGVNNHMGSRGTTDREMMTIILSELKRQGLFFLDSYTTKDSVVPSVAKKLGIPFLQRGVFLDNVDQPTAILKEITRLESVARDKGAAVAIGHYRKNTLDVLASEIPRLKQNGFQIISLRQLLEAQPD